MKVTKKNVRYPENLPLKDEVTASGVSINQFAARIGVTREVLSQTVNGHYKGVRIVKELKKELAIEVAKKAAENLEE